MIRCGEPSAGRNPGHRNLGWGLARDQTVQDAGQLRVTPHPPRLVLLLRGANGSERVMSEH